MITHLHTIVLKTNSIDFLAPKIRTKNSIVNIFFLVDNINLKVCLTRSKFRKISRPSGTVNSFGFHTNGK